MNEKICKKIIEQRKKVIPQLFTEKQVEIIAKYLKHMPLSKTEQTYLYAVIKKKIDALQSLEEGLCYIKGENMIPERVEQAKQILEHLNKERAFISGSFLFSKKYNDIDIFVIGKRRKQHAEGKRTYIGIREKDLKQPLFYSASQYSISNFKIPEIKPSIKRPAFDEIILAYQVAIKEILENDDQKMFRDLLFYHFIFIRGIIPNSYQLSTETQELIKKEKEEKITWINKMMKELSLKLYSGKYICNILNPFKNELKEDIKHIKKHENFLIYIGLFGDIIDQCRRAKA